ncbi:hypothetical protein CW713_07015 [Methanophagales archaeon]|nr:MAG: hypothetical protein CW713_07015 [Methanophagales archaeon]
MIWISVPGRDDVYGTWSETNGVDNASELIKHIIDEYCNGDISNLHSKTQDQILDMLKDATINMVGSDDLACIMELSVEYLSYSFYKKIKVNSGADTGNYTILVLSPRIDGVYGDSSYKYIDSILDLDGAGPELGAIDVSNKTKEEIVSTIKDVTIDQAGSDDLLWKGHLTVYQPKVIYVDDDFENDPANHRWNTIQKGINDANSGDMVYVYAGNYNENVILNKSITLQGEDRDNTIIDGGGNGDVINVTADNCMISEFTVQNGNCGIMMYESSNNTVMSNNASSNNYGIDLKWSDNNNITNNTANFNSIGIHLFHSNNNMISNNILNLNEKYGIKLMDSSDYNTVSGNIASSNKIGITLSEALDNNILDNTITNNRFAIYLLHSNNNTISKNICLNNWIGIELWYSNANTISNNNCSLNKDEGIYLQLSNNNAISIVNCITS